MSSPWARRPAPGKIYGAVDPIWEQANVLADVITGKNPASAYLGSKLGTSSR